MIAPSGESRTVPPGFKIEPPGLRTASFPVFCQYVRMEWIWAVVGAVLGIGGNFIFEYLRSLVARNSGGKLAIEGTWCEWTPEGYGRQFSVGVIRYRFWKRRYDFDGTNYHNDGRPFCHWSTTASYVDKERKEFHYIFANHDLSSPHVQSYGYGVVALVPRGNELVPSAGFYLYSGPVGARQMGHSMVPVTDPALFLDRSVNAAKDLKKVCPKEWQQRSDAAPIN
ncbi:hypothetical protein HTS88_08855 [Pseudarthrobacter oxydans]|uniref:hypothetical protein n=1 Tax=Pseudarthrobacter oxydans TaxID=1671 RepID=UPI0015716F3E|nr:hypothetical protein [Pseudarthrobacter oxydans]NSX36519.1 hypothetical protein [Pseudarthrobacter oxydans]